MNAFDVSAEEESSDNQNLPSPSTDLVVFSSTAYNVRCSTEIVLDHAQYGWIGDIKVMYEHHISSAARASRTVA